MKSNLQNDPCSEFEVNLQKLLGTITVNAWRLYLRTPYTHATTPMIRGVWGRALRHVDRALYDEIFIGSNQQSQNLPRYILRPAPADPNTAPAIDLILFNVDENCDQTIWKSWEMASVMGLGKNREPFRIRRRECLTSDNAIDGFNWNSWTLSDVQWPLPNPPESTPCQLRFDVPLRLIKKRSLLRTPEFSDLITASFRRIALLAGLQRSASYAHLIRTAKFLSSHTEAHPWVGEKCNLVRWSGAQQREVELFGVTGSIVLPNGAGAVWPLISASQWSHLGKGTVFGMGQIQIMNMSSTK